MKTPSDVLDALVARHPRAAAPVQRYRASDSDLGLPAWLTEAIADTPAVIADIEELFVELVRPAA